MKKNLLIAKIKENDMTQRSVAAAIGISENTFTSRVNGRTSFDTMEVRALCNLLHIDDDAEKVRIFLT
jgi:cyanate lyase